MEYLLDTITLVRYLTKNGRITPKVKKIFQQAHANQCILVVSSITLMEILYLGEKNRIKTTVEKTIKAINSSSIYRIVNLTPDIILTAKYIRFYELHDRMILATAMFLDIPVISSDEKFKSVKGINTIW